MNKDKRVQILREKNIEYIKTLLEKEGKYTVFSDFASFFDKRTYFKIDDMGNIKIKEYSPLLLIYAFSNDKDKLAKYLFDYSYLEEKQNLKKIERASNLTIEELRIKLIKTLYSGNLEFSKIFAKELCLRSKKDFYEVLYTFSLMGNPQNIKMLFVYALEKIFDEFEYNDNILYIVISYLTKVRDEYSIYENALNENITISEKDFNEDKKIYLEIFNKIITKYEFENKNKFKNSLNKYFNKDFILNKDLKNILLENKK